MANIVPKTEAFDDTAEWTQSDSLTVTANSDAAPAFAGSSAGRADTLVDANASNICTLTGGFHSIPSDSSDWLLSLFVKKDTVTTRFPIIQIDMQNGTRVQAYALLDTMNGLITNTGDGPGNFDAIGVVDVDALWWRFWARKANNNTGNNAIRCLFSPAYADSSAGFSLSSLTGSIIAWGANLTNTSTVQTYEPDPFYAFTSRSDGLVLITHE